MNKTSNIGKEIRRSLEINDIEVSDDINRLIKLSDLTDHYKSAHNYACAVVDDSTAKPKRVYDDPIQYFAEYIVEFDLLKADKVRDNYSEYEIIRAFIGKYKYDKTHKR